jgi:hypothetical protein
MLWTNLILVLALLVMIGIAVWLFVSSGQEGPGMQDDRTPGDGESAGAKQVRISDTDDDRGH